MNMNKSNNLKSSIIYYLVIIKKKNYNMLKVYIILFWYKYEKIIMLIIDYLL